MNPSESTTHPDSHLSDLSESDAVEGFAVCGATSIWYVKSNNQTQEFRTQDSVELWPLKVAGTERHACLSSYVKGTKKSCWWFFLGGLALMLFPFLIDASSSTPRTGPYGQPRGDSQNQQNVSYSSNEGAWSPPIGAEEAVDIRNVLIRVVFIGIGLVSVLVGFVTVNSNRKIEEGHSSADYADSDTMRKCLIGKALQIKPRGTGLLFRPEGYVLPQATPEGSFTPPNDVKNPTVSRYVEVEVIGSLLSLTEAEIGLLPGEWQDLVRKRIATATLTPPPLSGLNA